MKYTENYNLPLYEPNDLANLMDGYNESMNTLDDVMKTNIDVVDDYTDTVVQNKADIAADKKILDDEIARATKRESEIETSATSNFNQLVKNVYINNRKFLWIGDSYSAELHIDDWSPIYYLRDVRNLNIDNKAKDGAGFVGTVTDTFLEQLKSPTDKSIYTDVVVYGGNNDFGRDQDTVLSAIDAFCSYFKTNYPANCNLWYFASNKPFTTSSDYLYKYVNRMQINCNRARIFSNVNGVQLASGEYQATDNTHPTKLCGLYLADYFNKVLNGAEASLDVFFNATSFATGVSSPNFVMHTTLNGLYIDNFRLTISEDASFSDGSELFSVNFMLPDAYSPTLIMPELVSSDRNARVYFARNISSTTGLYYYRAKYFGKSALTAGNYDFAGLQVSFRNIR